MIIYLYENDPFKLAQTIARLDSVGAPIGEVCRERHALRWADGSEALLVAIRSHCPRSRVFGLARGTKRAYER